MDYPNTITEAERAWFAGRANDMAAWMTGIQKWKDGAVWGGNVAAIGRKDRKALTTESEPDWPYRMDTDEEPRNTRIMRKRGLTRR